MDVLPGKQPLHLLVGQDVLMTGAIAFFTIPAPVHCFADQPNINPIPPSAAPPAMCDAVQFMQGIRSTWIAYECTHSQAACRPYRLQPWLA